MTVGFSSGVLTVGGDLFVSQEFRDSWALQEGLDVGSFQLTASAVPEPSSTVMLLGGITVAGVIARVRRRRRVVDATRRTKL